MDLYEASHAAELIIRDNDGEGKQLDHWTKKLFITAMVVSYMRPFTGQDSYLRANTSRVRAPTQPSTPT